MADELAERTVRERTVRDRTRRRTRRTGPGRPAAPPSTATRGLPVGRALGGFAARRGRRPHLSTVSRRIAKPTPSWRLSSDQLDLIAGLIEAGVTIEQALETLASMSRDGVTRRAAAEAAVHVRAGRPLSVVVRELGAAPAVSALLAGAERTGRTAEALRGAAELVGRLEQLAGVVRRATTYPAVVLGVGLVMLTVIAVAVVPPLERTFLDLGGELPAATRVVLGASAVLRSPWLAVGLAVLVLARRPLRAALERTPLQRALRWTLDRAPVVRAVRRDLDVGLIARLLATMLEAGVPLVDALDVAERAVPDGRSRDHVRGARDALQQGRSALDKDGLGPLLDIAEFEILAVAERTGLLAEQWRRVAQRRATALEERITRLGSALEPLLVVIVGLVVGGAVVALYLPTFRVLELL